MGEEKLEDYVRMYKNGDDFAFGKIADALTPYFIHLTKKFRISGMCDEDLIQEGLIALAHKAIKDYCPTKGSFICFAKLCIKRHIITAFKSSRNGKHKALNGSVSIDSQCDNEDEEQNSSKSWHLETGEIESLSKIVTNENNERMRIMLIDKLTPLERQVFLCYLKSMSYNDIVKAINKKLPRKKKIKAKTVDNALWRAKTKANELKIDLSGTPDDLFS